MTSRDATDSAGSDAVFVPVQRMNYGAAQPALYGKLLELGGMLKKGSLEKSLGILVDLRASQINGCAFCVDMHSKQAKLNGERERRLYALAAWRESNLFTVRERLALEFTEAVTRQSEGGGHGGVSDELYARMTAEFSEAELAELAIAVGMINVWNRLAVTFRATPGSMDRVMGLDKAGVE